MRRTDGLESFASCFSSSVRRCLSSGEMLAPRRASPNEIQASNPLMCASKLNAGTKRLFMPRRESATSSEDFTNILLQTLTRALSDSANASPTMLDLRRQTSNSNKILSFVSDSGVSSFFLSDLTELEVSFKTRSANVTREGAASPARCESTPLPVPLSVCCTIVFNTTRRSDEALPRSSIALASVTAALMRSFSAARERSWSCVARRYTETWRVSSASIANVLWLGCASVDFFSFPDLDFFDADEVLHSFQTTDASVHKLAVAFGSCMRWIMTA